MNISTATRQIKFSNANDYDVAKCKTFAEVTPSSIGIYCIVTALQLFNRSNIQNGWHLCVCYFFFLFAKTKSLIWLSLRFGRCLFCLLMPAYIMAHVYVVCVIYFLSNCYVDNRNNWCTFGYLRFPSNPKRCDTPTVTEFGLNLREIENYGHYLSVMLFVFAIILFLSLANGKKVFLLSSTVSC